MKRLSAFILALTLLTLVGCNNTDVALSDNQSDVTSVIETVTSEIVPFEEETVSTEASTTETVSNYETLQNSSTVKTNSTTNENTSSIVSTPIANPEVTSSVTYNNPPYGTVTMIHPDKLSCEFNVWGWKSVTVTHKWFEDVDGGSWGLHCSWLIWDTETDEEQMKVWYTFADNLISHLEPKNDGVSGEEHQYVIWIWLDKENAGTGIDWNTPEYGTVSLEDPLDAYENREYIGGPWGWKQQYLIWKWCVDEGEDKGYWSNVQQGFYYNPDVDDPNDEWEKYASKYVACPERDGEYIGETVYKTAWVWLP